MSASKDLSVRAPTPIDPKNIANLPAVLQGTGTDAAFVLIFASVIIVAIPQPPQSWVEAILLRDPLGFQASLQGWTSLDHAPLDAGTSDRAWKLIVAPVPLQEALDFSGRLTISIEIEDGNRLSFHAQVAKLTPGPHCDPFLRSLVVAAAEAGAIDLRASSVVGDRCRWVASEDSTPLAFLGTVRGDDGLLIEGWMQDAKLRSFAFTNKDFTSYVPVEDMILKAVDRPAASAASRKRRAQVTKLEGFLAALPLNGCRSDEFFVVEHLAGETLMSGPYQIQPTNNTRRLVEELFKCLEADPELTAEKCLAVISAVTRRRSVAPVFKTQRFGPQSDPHVSVIITMSGDEIFLQSLLHQQARFSARIEWILCLEVGNAAATFARLIANQHHRLRGSIKLVVSDTSCGTIHLRNAGAQGASGDILVFAEESLWFQNRRPWLVAFLALRDRTYDVVGVGMSLEDGGMDNEGLVVQADLWLPRLPYIDYRNRGLSILTDERRLVVEPAEAVSSAALVTSRGRYFAVGGFDQAFEDGLYADGDFARLAAAMGASVGFVPGNGAVHPVGDFSQPADPMCVLADRLRYSVKASESPAQGLLT